MRLAIITPRYGSEVIGGAESLARGFAEELARRGWSVEVWTTCARNHYTWQNFYPVGYRIDSQLVIRRFPITEWSPGRHFEAGIRLAFQKTLNKTDQEAWLESGAHSAPLYAHIAKHADEFEALIALPYAMPLIHYAAWVAPHRLILWPCLHNEPLARLPLVRLLLETVRGVIFNSPEEKELTITQLGICPNRSAVLGAGVNLPSLTTQPERRQPQTLLYIGRLEEGKNLYLLYDYVRRYADSGGNIQLGVLGDGPVKPPHHPAFYYLGFVTEEAKAYACVTALAVCQPSLNESFSMTIMESWLAGRPVLVHQDCAVTRGHVQRSRGGLWFRTYDEFVSAVEWLQSHPDLADRMGHNGGAYVRENYTWSAVVSRFEQIVTNW